MPKMSSGGRKRRQQQRATEANLRREVSKSSKVAYTAAYRRWLIGRTFGWALMAVGVVMAVVHIGAHLGNFSLLPTVGMQDLLLGWPMAGLLFIIGAVFAGRRLRT
ncbi:hypothetical protein [Amycolatopsis tucumanensis]|uniref:Uncharacterized protein n=1 Tax=Amycolatopsis tucumanensis TaxID=401106 RepID=A0ABP7JW90_9PSEU|nr:hypothetical protein [Amycolatopsis tucumanensis]MCF6428479.1 hypothetical protein [Amycolatopsis tucumanensis]